MMSKGTDKSIYKCHCDRSSHTKEYYFKVVGYLKWWDHNRDLRNKGKISFTIIVEINTSKGVTGKSKSLVTMRGNNGKALKSSAVIYNSI